MSLTTEAPILLVEHEEERRVLIAGWLEDAGYDVLTCPGPFSARLFMYRQ